EFAAGFVDEARADSEPAQGPFLYFISTEQGEPEFGAVRRLHAIQDAADVARIHFGDREEEVEGRCHSALDFKLDARASLLAHDVAQRGARVGLGEIGARHVEDGERCGEPAIEELSLEPCFVGLALFRRRGSAERITWYELESRDSRDEGLSV